jgi:hypothetical protein
MKFKKSIAGLIFILSSHANASDLQLVIIGMMAKSFESGCLTYARHSSANYDPKTTIEFCGKASEAYRNVLTKELAKKQAGGDVKTDEGLGTTEKTEVSW